MMLSQIELEEIIQTTETIQNDQHLQLKHKGKLFSECSEVNCQTLTSNIHKLRNLKPYLPETKIDAELKEAFRQLGLRIQK